VCGGAFISGCFTNDDPYRLEAIVVGHCDGLYQRWRYGEGMDTADFVYL
jgi:hypothetical protein